MARWSLCLCAACISLTFFFGLGISKVQLGLLCRDGSCEWIPNIVYTGCLSDDVTVLTFVRFDSTNRVELSCTSVQLMYIDNTDLTCGEISTQITTPRTLSVQITNPSSSCVVTPYLTTAVSDMTQNHGGSTRGVEIPPTSRGPDKNIHGPTKNVHGPTKNVHGPTTNVHGPTKNVHEPTKNVHTTTTPMSTSQHMQSTTGIQTQPQMSMMTIIISKYLSISSFCLSLFTIFLMLTFLRFLYLKMKQNESIRRPIYTGSNSNISLDSFDSEGYLRPQIDDIYDEVL